MSFFCLKCSNNSIFQGGPSVKPFTMTIRTLSRGSLIWLYFVTSSELWLTAHTVLLISVSSTVGSSDWNIFSLFAWLHQLLQLDCLSSFRFSQILFLIPSSFACMLG